METQNNPDSVLQIETKVSRKKPFKVLVLIFALILVFAAGIFVGLEKARFSYSFGENYDRNFGPPRPPFIDRGFADAHGSAGQIISITNNTLSLKNDDGTEKIILINSQTTIRKGRADIKLADLKINDPVVVVGSPDSLGQIQALLIRVFEPFGPNTPPGLELEPK